MNGGAPGIFGGAEGSSAVLRLADVLVADLRQAGVLAPNDRPPLGFHWLQRYPTLHRTYLLILRLGGTQLNCHSTNSLL